MKTAAIRYVSPKFPVNITQKVSLFIGGLTLVTGILLRTFVPKVSADTVNLFVDLTPYYNRDVISFDANPTDGDFDGNGNTYSADTFPDPIVVAGVEYWAGPTLDGLNNAVGALGQTIALPAATANSIKILAAESYENFANPEFTVHYSDGTSEVVTLSGISYWQTDPPFYGETVAYAPAHRNTPAGPDLEEPPPFIFEYTIAVNNTKELESVTIPDYFEEIQIFAMTLFEATETVLAAPTVTTGSASNITINSATLAGEVTVDGGAEIIERGFVFSTSNNTPTTSDTLRTVDGTTGAMSTDLTGLQSDTLYYYRSYAINSEGTGYGTVQTFTTLEEVTYTNTISIPNDYKNLGIPQGISVLDNGNVWYVDQQNYRIIQVTQSSQIVRTLGRQGTADGEFAEPLQSITRDTSGNLYVLDTCHIYKFDSNGGFIKSWGSCGEETANSMREARGIHFDSVSGALFVTDMEHHRVLKFSQSGQFISKFGSEGTGNGQFKNPVGVTTDATGKIYVVDSDNHRVQVFNSAGVYQSKFGTEGFGDGQLTYPKGVLILSNGKIAVASQNSYRIQIFNADGSWDSAWGVHGTEPNQFLAPASLARDSSDNIFVSDWSLKSIQKFSSTGVYELAIRNSGKTDGKLTNPTGVAYDSAGNLLVLDDGPQYGRVQKFTNTGTYISTPIASGQLGLACYHIAVDSTDRILVSCQGNVGVFASTGEYLFTVGTAGTEDGQFQDARGVAVDSADNIYVTDITQSRVQKFDSEGNFLMTWGTAGMGNGEFNAPEWITIDSNDKVYVGEYFTSDHGIGLTPNSRVQVFNTDGTYVRTIGSFGEGASQLWDTAGIAVDNTANRVYVGNRNSHSIKVYTATDGSYLETIGSYGSDVAKFTVLGGLAINPVTSTITVADTENHRVQSFASGTRIVNLISSNEVLRQSDDFSISSNYVNPADPGVDSITSKMVFGDYIVSDFTVDLLEDRNWSQVSAVTLANTSKALLANLNPTDAPGVSATHSIYLIKKVGQTEVRVCPDATTLSEITMNCSNGYNLVESDPELSVVTIEGVDYWKVENLTGTGAMSLSTTSLSITPSSTNVTAGQDFTVTVNALDTNDDIDTTYRETVAFTSTSGTATLPSNYSYTEVDSGTHQFTVHFNEPGSYTITATDTITGALTATTASITVTATSPIVSQDETTPTGIGASGATLTGTISHNGGSAITERGVVYSTSNATPTISDSKQTTSGTTGAISVALTGLTGSTHYYARVYATNAEGTTYGPVIEFTTAVALSIPTIGTGSVWNIASTTAAVTCNVTGDGGASITQRGAVYSSTAGTPTTAHTKQISSGTTGSVNFSIISLTPSTLYHLRCYAINSQGTAYGSVMDFTTAAPTGTPTPTPTPTMPTSLQNVYFTFAKLKYNKYASPATMRKGDMLYFKNYDTKKLKLLQIFLYDYAKKGNQGYAKSKVSTQSMFLRTTSNLPTGKRYAYVAKFQDKATGIIATKYFVFYTTKTWLGKSVLGASTSSIDVDGSIVAENSTTETPTVTESEVTTSTTEPTSVPPTTTPTNESTEKSTETSWLTLVGGFIVLAGIVTGYFLRRKSA